MGFPLLFSDQIKYFKGPKDTKGVIRTRKSKNNRQHNDQKKQDKMTNLNEFFLSYNNKLHLMSTELFHNLTHSYILSYIGHEQQLTRR